MAPFIITKARDAGIPVTGEILLAGTARPPDQVLLNQVRTLTPDKDRPAALDKERDLFSKIRNPETPDTELVGGAPVIYWRDWLARDVAAEIAKAHVPTLVLWGDKDFQMSRADYDSLLKAGAPPLITGHIFPNLNHLFVPSHTVGIEDYATPEHVPPTVPTTIGLEKATNPFLRAPALADRVGAGGEADYKAFGAVRAAKDNFKG